MTSAALHALQQEAFKSLQEQLYADAKEKAHKAVEMVVRENQKASDEELFVRCFYSNYVLATASVELGETAESESLLDTLVPEEPAIVDRILHAGLLSALIACIDMRAALCVQGGHTARARRLYARSLELCKTWPPLQLAGDAVSAVELHVAALSWREKALGPVHEATTSSLESLGRALLAVGLWREALYTYTDAHKRLDGEALAHSRVELGMAAALRMMGRHEEAKQLAGGALVTREAAFGPTVAQSAGDLPLAVPALERVLQLRRRALGPAHPDTLAARAALATVALQSGDVHEAHECLREVAAAAAAAVGDAHPFALSCLAKCAEAALLTGRVDEARIALERALHLGGGDARSMGVVPAQALAAVLTNLGNAERARGDLHGALGTYERALGLYRAACGALHAHVAVVRSNIGCTLVLLGRVEDAMRQFTAALAIRQVTHGAMHPLTGQCHHNVGVAHWHAGRRSAALRSLLLASDVCRVNLGAHHPQTRTAQALVARVRRGDPPPPPSALLVDAPPRAAASLPDGGAGAGAVVGASTPTRARQPPEAGTASTPRRPLRAEELE